MPLVMKFCGHVGWVTLVNVEALRITSTQVQVMMGIETVKSLQEVAGVRGRY